MKTLENLKAETQRLTSELLHHYYDNLGIIYDCVFGLNILIRHADKHLKIRKVDIINKDYEKMHEYAHVFSFQKDINDRSTIYYVTSGPDIYRRIVSKQDETFLAKMFIVHFFEIWESSIRNRIAIVLNKTKEEIRIPILGDLCKIRNSIIHNKGIANRDMNRCESIKNFKYGDPIIMTSEVLWEIKLKLEEAMEKFIQELFNV